MKRFSRYLLFVVLGTLLIGCAQEIIRSQKTPAWSGIRATQKIGIAPFQQSGELDPDASDLVSRYVAEAFGDHRLEVIPAGDIQRAVDHLGLQDDPYTAESMSALASEFGIQVFLVGDVLRFRQRVGEELGATQAASVAFRVRFYDPRQATLLARADFDETQHALNENLLRARHYPGRGSRWLSAQELARWGARELAAVFVKAATPESSE